MGSEVIHGLLASHDLGAGVRELTRNHWHARYGNAKKAKCYQKWVDKILTSTFDADRT